MDGLISSSEDEDAPPAVTFADVKVVDVSADDLEASAIKKQ